MYKHCFITTTPSSRINIELSLTLINKENLIDYENKPYFQNLCKEGCVNYGKKWACPPYSPTYTEIAEKYNYAIILLLHCDLRQFSHTKTEYMKIKASNSILRSRSDRFIRFLEDKLTGTVLSNGSCRLCKPCNRSNSSFCKKPHLMRYSMESLGLNVEKIALDLFNHPLLWYKNKLAPQYSSVVSCLMTNTIFTENQLLDIIKKIDTI